MAWHRISAKVTTEMPAKSMSVSKLANLAVDKLVDSFSVRLSKVGY